MAEAQQNEMFSDDESFALLVATGTPTKEVARICGINEGNVWRRRQKPEVVRLVGLLRQALADQAMGKLMSLYTRHIENLDRLATDEKVSAAARMAGSRSVIELGAKLRRDVELEARLKAVEDRLASQGGAP